MVVKHNATIIACACHKGGVGKTTTAASLGGLISRGEGKRVLLVDADPQMNLTTTFTEGSFRPTLFDSFVQYKRSRVGELPVYNIRENLDLVPSELDLCTVDADFASVPGRDVMLRKMLAPLRERYDWIFIDCPAQLGALTINALAAADHVLVPMSCDAYSADGLLQIRSFVDIVKDINEKLDILGVVVTKFRPRRMVDQIVSEQLDGAWSDLVFKTRIRENTAIVKAPISKQDVYSYDRRSYGAQDYCGLYQEICNKLKIKNKKQ